MPSADSLLVLTIAVTLNAVDEDDDAHRPLHESIELNLGVGDTDEADEALTVLGEIAAAIKAGRLYGWMMQQGLQMSIDAGDVRSETTDEMFDRIRRNEPRP